MHTVVSTPTDVSHNDRVADHPRFMIVGHGRLALSVARKLADEAAEVVIVTRDASAKRDVEAQLGDLATSNGNGRRTPRARVVSRDDRWNVWADDGLDLKGFKCMLALADQREDNLRAALVARHTAECRTVLRAFHPSIAYRIEAEQHGADWQPYSMAHLAAPWFVAAALLEGDDRYIETIRLGDDYIAVCSLTVRDTSLLLRRRRTRLRGQSATDLLQRAGCQVIASRTADGQWDSEAPSAGHQLQPGDQVVIGGPMANVFALVRNPSRRLECGLAGMAQADASSAQDTATATRNTHPRGRLVLAWRSLRTRTRDVVLEASTLASKVLVSLIAMVTLVVVLFFPLHGIADAVYLWAITALGNPSQNSPHHEVVSAIGLLSGGLALGLWVSLMSAYFIERRIIETTQARARRLRQHVVVVGLSDVGLRVAELLGKIGIRYAIVDTGGDDAARRSLELARDRPPILSGELENALELAGVDRAVAVIACSDDNLINVEACLRAKQRAGANAVRTVARIFDDVVAERAANMFGVDKQIAAVDVAAPAFVDAAVHGDGVREIDGPDGLSLKALRLAANGLPDRDQVADWNKRGIRVLGVWGTKGLKPPHGHDLPRELQSLILAGDAETIERLHARSQG